MKVDPVPLFDKTSINSSPTIELLTIPEVARLLKISVSGVRRLQQQRHIPFIKIGGSVRFAKNDIMSYLKKNRVESIDQIYVWQQE
jgi:excisionase family DNA binding protein